MKPPRTFAATARTHASAAIVLSVIACESERVCLTPPCPPAIAVEVHVRSTASLTPIAGAFVLRGSPQQRLDCDAGESRATCYILGPAGEYAFEVGAEGHVSVSRSVVVTGTSSGCGCPQVTTRKVDVQLESAR